MLDLLHPFQQVARMEHLLLQARRSYVQAYDQLQGEFHMQHQFP